jgi:hypothetical protein
MVDEREPDPILDGKTPAPVTPPSRRSSGAAAKKAGAAKKSPAKKAAAKKAPAKKKSSVQKSPAKKAGAKKPSAKKSPAKKSPVAVTPAEPRHEAWVPGTDVPVPDTTSVHTTPPEHPMTRGGHLSVVRDDVPHVGASARAAVLSVTQDLLNDLVLFAVGGGVELEPLETSLALPGMGEVDVRLALTITGAALTLSSADDGRARVVVRADGDVSARSVAFGAGPEDVPAGAMGLPVPPAPIPVRVEALVRPEVELREDHSLSVGLDLSDATLVELAVDDEAPTPEGVDPSAWQGMLSMFSMMFGVLGSGLFDSLGEHVGTAGLELPADVGDLLVQLGVAPGRAEVSVASGTVTVSLAGDESLGGRALPVPVAGTRLGLGLANSVVDRLAHLLVLRAAGDLPVPFELEVDLGEQQVAGRLRQTRILPEFLPDLRSSLRTEVRTRLVGGRLELAVQSAWVELPPVVPSLFNQLSRRIGGLVSLAPMKVRFPATIDVPLPDADMTLPIRIDDLRVTSDGLGIVLSLA